MTIGSGVVPPPPKLYVFVPSHHAKKLAHGKSPAPLITTPLANSVPLKVEHGGRNAMLRTPDIFRGVPYDVCMSLFVIEAS
jgi:hypothetical protein